LIGADLPKPRRIIPRDALTSVHEANALTGEIPCWDAARETLWWVDIQGQRVLGYSPRTGCRQEHNVPSMPGLLVLRESGGLLLGLEDGLYPFAPESGVGERLIAVEADDARTRINDGAADPSGRLWFGTMDKSGSGQPIGSLYCLSPDLDLRVLRSGIGVPNAISFSPDGRTFYFADSTTRTIEAHDYDPKSGQATSSRPFIRYPPGEKPDGVCIDLQGALWVAVVDGGRLERRLANGRLDLVVELPVSRPTMPALGGEDGRTLFVTSQRRFLNARQLASEPLAGDLLMTTVKVPGVPLRTVSF
jgi:sugar lactone lactonase YvrE